MKLKIIYFTILLFSTFFFDKIYAQNQEVLIGKFHYTLLNQEPFIDWKSKNYNYNPDYIIIKELKKVINNKQIKIIIILGTWCSDSQMQVPRFLKILDDINFNYNNLTLIGVNREKQAETIDISKYKISRVPTFIFFNKDKEIGRITETPENSLEKDFLNTISKK